MAWKASFSEMNQYIHLLSNTGINLPIDLWVPATERVKPQNSRQVSMGLVKDFTKQNFFISLEGYYKEMHNIIGYKEGASFVDLEDPETGKELTWEDNVTPGKGWSYGAELLIQRKFGKVSGWIGYTLSWTKLQFDVLNFGREFYARYDRRHDISVVCIYNPFKNITISGVWVYGTGNSITLPVSEFPNEQNYYKVNISGFKYYYDKEFGYGGNYLINQFSTFIEDKGNDGKEFNFKLDLQDINKYTDSVYLSIIVLQTDKSYYDFHKSLQNYSFDDNPFTEVTHLYSNITGGLGVFCGYTKQEFLIRLK